MSAPVIMLVDDDSFFHDLCQRILGPAGYQLHTFLSPEDALAAIDKVRPDLVITDLMMTDLHSGFVLAREIRGNAAFKHVPIMVITSIRSHLGMDFSPQGDDEKAAMLADAFLEKPLTPRILLETIQRLIRATPELG